MRSSETERRRGINQVVAVLAPLAAGVAIGVDLLRDDVDGLLAAGAVLLLVLAASLVFDGGADVLRAAVVGLAVAGSAVVVAEFPAALDERPPWWLHAILAVALGGLIGKLLLLRRFAAISGSKAIRSAEELNRLLPFQQEALGRLQNAILTGRTSDAARLIQLAGRWGEGKSFLIERLEIALNAEELPEARRVERSNCAVVVIDVWKYQSEPDLHLAVVEEILGHRVFWHPYGWLLYPLTLFLVRVVKEIRFAISAGSTPKAKVELPLTVPRLTGQHSLQRLVARARRRSWRTVVVLDEVDRAAPPVVQAAVTLARRSLDMPGVVVVLSYVDELIRYKAFNPLLDSLQDLGSTMRAVIFAEGPEQGNLDRPGGRLNTADPGALVAWEAWKQAGANRVPAQSSADTAAPPDDRKPPTLEQDDKQLSEAVRLAYAGVGPSHRRVLQQRFAERYLGTRPIELHRPDDHDVAKMVTSFDTLSYLVEDLVGTKLDDQRASRVTGAIELALTTWKSTSLGADQVAPPIRALEGELFRRLSSVRPERGGLAKVSLEFVAAVVLAAYDAAGLQFATRTTPE
jgi:KAP family P-loop domain